MMAPGNTDYMFGYNSEKFSDRVLKIVVSQAPRGGLQVEGDDESDAESTVEAGEPGSSLRKSSPTEEEDPEMEVMEVRVSSLLLAGLSSFFRGLLSSDHFGDSNMKKLEVRIKPEEKQPLEDLLRFMYSGKLPAAQPVDSVMALWLMAQQFGVPACIEQCLVRLQSYQMTLASANYFLDKAAVVEQSPAFSMLIDSAVQFLVEHFQAWESKLLTDEDMYREMMGLPLAAVEGLISCSTFRATDESNVVFLVLTWIRQTFAALEERVNAMERLVPHIRLPLLNTETLRAVSQQREMQGSVGKSLVLEALWYRAAEPTTQVTLLNRTKEHGRYKRRLASLNQVSNRIWRRVKVVREVDIKKQIGVDLHFDLVDDDKVLSIYALKQVPFRVFKEEVQKELGLAPENQRYWLFSRRQNFTCRPLRVLTPADEAETVGYLRSISNIRQSTSLFLEEGNSSTFPASPPQPLPVLQDGHILLFLKFYDPLQESLRFIGHVFAKQDSTPSNIEKDLRRLAGLGPAEPFVLFEEIKWNPAVMCEPVSLSATLKESQLENGDILCIQRPPSVYDTDPLVVNRDVCAYFEFQREKMELEGVL